VQVSAVEAPVDEEYFPEGQLMQELEFCADRYLPAAQLVQEVAADAEYIPRAHDEQMGEPTLSANKPEAQLVHIVDDVEPVVTKKVPKRQPAQFP